MNAPENHVLIGNAFPLSLVRRQVLISVIDQSSFQHLVKSAVLHSFWGHSNTLEAVNTFLGVDVSPRVDRPVLSLSAEYLPRLDGMSFRNCCVVSPDYVPGFRPGIGEVIPADVILGWQILEMSWIPQNENMTCNGDLPRQS